MQTNIYSPKSIILRNNSFKEVNYYLGILDSLKSLRYGSNIPLNDFYSLIIIL